MGAISNCTSLNTSPAGGNKHGKVKTKVKPLNLENNFQIYTARKEDNKPEPGKIWRRKKQVQARPPPRDVNKQQFLNQKRFDTNKNQSRRCASLEIMLESGQINSRPSYRESSKGSARSKPGLYEINNDILFKDVDFK